MDPKTHAAVVVSGRYCLGEFRIGRVVAPSLELVIVGGTIPDTEIAIRSQYSYIELGSASPKEVRHYDELCNSR